MANKYETHLTSELEDVVLELQQLNEPVSAENRVWRPFMQDTILLKIDEEIQKHLNDCPRCRFQSKFEKRRMTRKGKDVMIDVPTIEQMKSLCEDAVAMLSEYCGEMIMTEIDSKFSEAVSALDICRPSDQDMKEFERLRQANRFGSMATLRKVTEECARVLEFCRAKQPLVYEVEDQENAVRRLRECHERVCLMAESARLKNAISNSKFYVIVPETFENFVNKRIEAMNNTFLAKLPHWEADNKRFFEIDGQRWMDLPPQTLVVAEEELSRTRTSSAGNTKLGTPVKPLAASGRGRISSTPTKPMTPGRSSGTVRSNGAGINTGPATPRKTAASLQSKPQKLTASASEALRTMAPGIPLEPMEKRKRPDSKFMPTDTVKVSMIKPSAELKADSFVRVCIRVRPLVTHEIKAKHAAAVTCMPDGQSIQLQQSLSGKDKLHEMAFSTVLDGKSQQEDVFNKSHAHVLVEKALEGFSSTCFAYGQTGSGKTFTMGGPVDVLGLRQDARLTEDVNFHPIAMEAINEMLKENLKLQGLTPQLANYLFEQIEALENAEPNVSFRILASSVEIYNEAVQDLLTRQVKPLQVREHVDGSNTGFYVEGITEVEVRTIDELLDVFVQSTQNRMVTSHQMNSESSRSHLIFTLNVEKKVFDKDVNTIWLSRGKISLVDLAGSESVKLTRTTGSALQETAGINKSLLALSSIVSKLSESGGTSESQVGWRNSRLTMLLMDSLVGAGCTIMLACCSPSDRYLAETLSTLQFATKAANITKSEVAIMSPHELEVMNLKAEIDKLRIENEKLKGALSKAGVSI